MNVRKIRYNCSSNQKRTSINGRINPLGIFFFYIPPTKRGAIYTQGGIYQGMYKLLRVETKKVGYFFFLENCTVFIDRWSAPKNKRGDALSHIQDVMTSLTDIPSWVYISTTKNVIEYIRRRIKTSSITKKKYIDLANTKYIFIFNENFEGSFKKIIPLFKYY